MFPTVDSRGLCYRAGQVLLLGIVALISTACGDGTPSTPTSTPLIRVVTATPDAAKGTVTPLVIVVTATPQPTQEPPTEVPTAISTATVAFVPDAVLSADNVNLRTGPGYGYPSVGKYSKGYPLIISSKDESGEWALVQGIGQVVGWMRVEFMALNVDWAKVPIIVSSAIAPPPVSPTPTPTDKELPRGITVVLLSKGFDQASNALTFSLRISNNLRRDVRAFQGLVVFWDVFDRRVAQFNISETKPLAAWEQRDNEFTVDYDPTVTQRLNLKATEFKDLRTTFELGQVIYADGTKEEFP